MWAAAITDGSNVPKPRRAPTLPRTCSAHFFASSRCCRSLTAASAVFIAADACVKILPHHPPPCCSCPAAARFSPSCSSELVALGVKLARIDLALSVLFLAPALSSDFRAGPFSSERRARGVCGREGGCEEVSSDSSSASMSSPPALGGVFLAAPFLTSGMPSKRESTSSSAVGALFRLAAMIAFRLVWFTGVWLGEGRSLVGEGGDGRRCWRPGGSPPGCVKSRDGPHPSSLPPFREASVR